jgi:hypothetical protein
MAVAHRSEALIRIEAYNVEHAGALVRALVRVLDADEIALDGERFEVEIRPWGDPDASVLRALDVVEGWLAGERLDSTVVHVLGRSYRIGGVRTHNGSSLPR